jgi:DNA gyrase/topoisomerase IV subunit B
MAKDSKMYHVKSDIQKVQIKTNMYINEYGPQGTFHMGREIIQNCFDECLDTDSQGNKIEIEYDTDTDILKASDNGRGFNEKEFPMNTFCETLQSGSKFFRSAGNASAGEFRSMDSLNLFNCWKLLRA